MEPVLASLVEKLRRALALGPRLRLALLFGSAVVHRLRPDSDLDVAILPQDLDLSLREELELARGLSRACARTVDLVRLDHASTLLRWQVARDGLVLLADPPQERVRFLARAAAEHADLAPALRVAARRYHRYLVQQGGEVPR